MVEDIPDVKTLSREQKKHFREAVRGALQVVGNTWTRDIAPKHFTHAGAKEYGYQLRTKKYILRKVREYTWDKKKGLTGRTDKRRAIEPNTPLVYTGNSREAVRETRFTVFRSRDYGVQVARGIIDACTLNLKRSAKSPNMRAEVTAISTADTEVLRGVFVREFNARFTKR